MSVVTEYYGNLIECAYLFNIIMCEKCKGFYSSFNKERIELHDKIAEKYNLTREQVAKITNNLDQEIGFNSSNDYAESELVAFANKLILKLKQCEVEE